MQISDAYQPSSIFSPASAARRAVPRVFIAPQRYVQGPGVLEGVGRYLSVMPVRRVALLMSARGLRSEGVAIQHSLRGAGIDCMTAEFSGECSLPEIESHVLALADERIECVVAAGGGKCIDAGKAVAFRLNAHVVVVPTLASNDAPCSALSVLYTPSGVSTGVEFYPNSPAFVVVDTDIVAAAPERYLVAGMGDAMATWYEADVCLRNPHAVTTVGARPTLASCAIGETCAHTLFNEGVAAAASVRAKSASAALESVVEANTLLSGLGFESGGLAAAHGVAQSYTAIASVHANYLHGEMVAMGTLAQLMMERRQDEAIKVATFFASVGLPINLGQLSLGAGDARTLDIIAEQTLEFPFIGNMPMAVTADIVRAAVTAAETVGRSVQPSVGDTAYRRLHAG